MRTKKLLSLILTLCVVLTTIGSLSIAASAAEVTTYQFYTLVGDEFIPNTNAATEGVTWNNTTVDTSVMGRRIITGKDGSGNDVKGIVNVGVKKWMSYDNNESYTVGDGVVSGNGIYDRWKRAGSSGYDNFGFYTQDPVNSENTVVVYEGVNLCLDYFTQTKIAENVSFSVETKLLIAGGADRQARIEIYGADSSTKVAYLDVRWSNARNQFYLVSNDTTNLPITVDADWAADVGIDKTNVWLGKTINEWINLKFVVVGKTVTIYESGTKIATINAASDITKGFAFLRIKDSSNTVANTYVDDVKITNLTTENNIYYDEFENEYNYDYIQSAGTQEINVNETVKFVDKDGNDSGYSTEIYAKATADTSNLGTFKDTTDINGFDEPITVSWTVYKKQFEWIETFEGYTEADLGNAPHIEPWSGSAFETGNSVTVEYEDPQAENKNFILKHTTTVVNGFKAKFTNQKTVSGKYSVSFKVKVPEIYETGSGLNFQISGSNGVLIEPSISFNTTGGYITCRNYTAYDGTTGSSSSAVNLVDAGNLVANSWYTLTFNIDIEKGTFTYECIGTNANVSSEEYGLRNKGDNPFSYLQFGRRNTVVNEQIYYLDDIFVTKILTIKEPVSQKFTVYKGDPVGALPERATVLLTDDETYDTAPVVWSAASLDTNTVGVKSVTGTVKGTDKKATVTVNVSAFPYEIVMPSLKSDGKEVCGLIKGGSIDAAYIKKISNDTLAGKVYAALYDENMKLLGADVATINTINTWNKDDSKDIEMLLGIPNSADIDIDNCTLKLFTFSDSLVPFAELKVHKNADIEQSATTVYIAGDSTASIKKDSLRPEMGWGEAFATLCSGTGITVDNRAVDGQSSKSFYDNGMLNNILNDAEKGDYIFINLGSNDAPGKGEERETNPTEGGTYEEYLTKYITEARAKGVIPVILTSMIRARWTTANDISNAGPKFIGDTLADLDKYAAAAKRIAAKYHVPMIDLHAITTEFVLSKTSNPEAWTAEEKAEVWKYFDYYKDAETLVEGNKDTSHLNAKGAEFVANAIVDELKAILHPLGTLFN